MFDDLARGLRAAIWMKEERDGTEGALARGRDLGRALSVRDGGRDRLGDAQRRGWTERREAHRGSG